MEARRDGWWPRVRRVALVAGLGALGVGCGGGGDDGGGGDLSPDEEAGRALVVEYTCQACHGQNLAGGMAPALAGLPGQTVTLANGETVVADDAYLTESIADPSAQIAQGEGIMPQTDMTPEQIAQVVAYIKTLPAPDG